MGQTTFLKLTAICLISSTVPSATALSTAIRAAQALGLVSRASDSCTVSGYTPCNTSGLPSSFCCPSDTTCIAFNHNASAICCPAGHDCQQIQPITCDLTQQNATLHPDGQLHSSDLTGTLQTCGNSCCPQGFSCENSQCFMNNQTSSTTTSLASSAAKSSSPSSSKSSSPSSSSKATTTTTNPTPAASTTTHPPSAASQTSSPTPSATSNSFPATAVLAGFFPGIVVGILLTILLILCLRRRHRSKSDPSNHRGTTDFGRISATVSDPIYAPQTPLRTDFLRRQPPPSPPPQRQNNSNNRTSRSSSRVRSLFSSSRSPSLVRHPDRALTRTPEMRKEPSTESIRIYSPPGGGFGGSRQTTFTEMMGEAGFRKGEPYLGSPGRVDPRARGI